MDASVRRILAQPYRYLDRGAKVRAYLSADGHYVLKTLNEAADVARWFAEDGRPLDGAGWDLGNDAVAAAEVLLARTRESYRLAAAELRKETGLIWLQLAPAGIAGLAVRLRDAPPFDAGRDPFILQCHAELVRHRIDACEAVGDQAASRAVLDDVIGLIATIWRKGITEDGFNFHNNYGYAGEEMIQVDIGEFHKSKMMVRAQLAHPKVLRKKSQAWLRRKYPPLAEYFEAQVHRRLSEEAFGLD